MKEVNREKDIYAKSRTITDIKECEFYHVMDIPNYGIVGEEWDLRNSLHEYLGNVDFKDKRVLELGTASGLICFHMEKMGAQVVAYDLSIDQQWDIVPFSQYDYKKDIHEYKNHINRLNNGFWFAHKAYDSKAKVIYNSIYEIPEEIGLVDISTFCSILLHVRDPFYALQNALRLTKETVIITDMAQSFIDIKFIQNIVNFINVKLFRKKRGIHNIKGPWMKFLPNYGTVSNQGSWWALSPEAIINFIGVLGFEKTTVTYHCQKFRDGTSKKFFTVVGRRTRPTNACSTEKSICMNASKNSY